MNILIPISGRSDAGLVAPVIKRLKARGHHTHIKNLWESWHIGQPSYWDWVLVCGDRTEQTRFALQCFLDKIPIAHLYAGVSNEIATFDDINRHCITLWSDVQFCENRAANWNVWNLLKDIGKKRKHIYTVGITHLDDLEVDDSYLPPHPYNLVLYNPPTLTQDIDSDLDQIKKLWKNYTIWIAPNKDEGSDIITQNAFEFLCDDFYVNLPRPKFLGLLKHCEKFITNSSVEYYEAPYFLKPEQIIHIGKRNLNRSSKGPLATGASDRIVQILEELYAK